MGRARKRTLQALPSVRGPVMSVAVKPGIEQSLEDRFLLIEEIARGGMATIYKARDLREEAQRASIEAIATRLRQLAFCVGFRC